MPEITVTSGDLAAGRPWPSANPLARAARRAFPGAWWVVAGLRSLTVIGRDGARDHPLPGNVSARLAAWYDRPGAVRPFRFTLPDGPAESGAAA